MHIPPLGQPSYYFLSKLPIDNKNKKSSKGAALYLEQKQSTEEKQNNNSKLHMIAFFALMRRRKTRFKTNLCLDSVRAASCPE